MAASGVGLSDTERVRFVCFGFDIASAALVAVIREIVLLSGAFGHSVSVAGGFGASSILLSGAFGHSVSVAGRLN